MSSKINMPKTRILIVEDSPTQAEVLKHMLEEDNHAVDVAPSGEAALQIIKDKKPDVIISDVVMPGMDGYTLCKKIKGDPRYAEIPVILVTSLSDPLDIVKGLECGANNFITKPYDPKYLLSRIHQIFLSQELTKHEKAQINLEFSFFGKKFSVASDRKQILDLLLSTYETAVQKNLELLKTKEELKNLNDHLEELVDRRTGALMSEITSRRLAEEELAGALREQKKMMEAIPDIFYVLNPQGFLIKWNRKLEQVTSLSREQLAGKPLAGLFSDKDQEAIATALDAAFRVGYAEVECDLLSKGVPVPHQFTCAVLKDEKGEVIGVTGIGRNISDRKRAEEEIRASNIRLREVIGELKATQEQVVRQERLRAIGTMAAGIAHDFNNALSPILGYSDLLLSHPENLENKEKVTRALQVIHLAAEDAGKVVSRLREFYRHRDQNEQRSPINLKQLVEQTLSLTMPRWKDQAFAEGVTIKIKTELADAPLVMGIETELRDVLTNLIFNAVDAMPKGGTISISLEKKENRALIKVSDTGIGMTEEVRKRCFEPFYSTKGEKGTGLGLSMVFGIVKRHEGTIDVQSREGEGTVFTIMLPIAKEPGHSPEQVTPSKTSQSLRVLIIEDEPAVREILFEYLAGDGHKVETAGNGKEGLQKFSPDRFDLVITDKGMPDLNGVEVAAIVKQMADDMPVIMLTGFGEMMNAAGERPAGVDLVVSKPVRLATLREALAGVSRKKSLEFPQAPKKKD